MRWRWAWLLMGLGCAPEPGAERASVVLDEGAVARVGPETIAGDTVRQIAAAHRLSPSAALDLAVHDATLAAGAREALSPREVARLESHVLAWALLEDVEEQSSVPLSDQELIDATDSDWTRYDRPEGRQTIHVVVRTYESTSPAEHARRRALAKKLLQALKPVAEKARQTEPEDVPPEVLFRWREAAQRDPVAGEFRAVVESVAGTNSKLVKVELLPPVGRNGVLIRHVLNDIPLSRAFTESAFELERRGDMSSVVETPSGYHVTLLLRRTEPLRVPRDRRLDALSPIVEKWRGTQAREKMLKQARARLPVERARNGLAWMRQLDPHAFEDDP